MGESWLHRPFQARRQTMADANIRARRRAPDAGRFGRSLFAVPASSFMDSQGRWRQNMNLRRNWIRRISETDVICPNPREFTMVFNPV